MERSSRKVTVYHPAPSQPTTVQELMDNLALYPMDYKISFEPFTLHRTKDRGGEVHFELDDPRELE